MPWSGPRCFAELKERAQTIDDIAQALAQEQGDPQTSELRVWAAAVRACVESHARDMEIVNPWARLQPKQTIRYCRNPEQASAGMGQSYTRLSEISRRWMKRPRYFVSVLSELAAIRERLLRDPAKNADLLARIDVADPLQSPDARMIPRPWCKGFSRSRKRPIRCFSRWISNSCLTTRKSFFPLDFVWPMEAWIPVVTICWPLKRV